VGAHGALIELSYRQNNMTRQAVWQHKTVDLVGYRDDRGCGGDMVIVIGFVEYLCLLGHF
jgi:hypothetical protein